MKVKHKARWLISLTLCFVMLLGILPTSAFSAEAESEEPAAITNEVQEDIDSTASETISEDPVSETADTTNDTTPTEDTASKARMAVEQLDDNDDISLLADEDDTTAMIDLSGNIVWVNREQQSSNSRPTSVTLTLYANGTATDTTITVSEPSADSNKWKFTFSNLPETDESGKAINYTVSQNEVTGYETVYSADTLTITNSYTGGKPSNHTFGHIDVRIAGASLEMQYVVKDGNGVVISKKVETIEAYVTNVESVTINGTVYNTGFTKSGNYEFRKTRGVSINSKDLTDESTAVLVVDLVDKDGKTYDDISITYGLGGIMAAAYECDGYRNGRFDGLDFVVGKAQNYVIEITSYGLPVNVQKYIQTGDNVEEFSGKGEEFSFLLTEYNEDGKPTGRIWTISNDESGAGQTMITYPYNSISELEAYNGQIYKYTLSEVEGTDPQYNYDSKVYEFTVKLTVETDDADNTTLVPSIIAVEPDNNEPFTFTNTVKTTSVSVNKKWADNDNQDGKRPQSITVKLLADGLYTGKNLILSADNQWTGSFENLDQYKGGTEIKYTVQEVEVVDYTTVMTENQNGGYTITNTHTPETVNISGSKTWIDNNNQDNVRPKSITINLLKNGQKIESKVVTEANQWTWSFTDLPKYENGEEINYAITEEAVAQYSTSYDGYDVTNTHTPYKISVTVTKSWQDNNDQDRIRPNEVTVKLLADGKDTNKTLILNEGNNWTGSFENLDQNKNGEAIKYTVEEISVAGYSYEVTGNQKDGYTIINTHIPELADDIYGSKTWNDNNNQDNVRPESITINLLKNGDKIDSKVVTEADQWTWSFTGLPKYENGEEINYAITEDAVAQYSTSYDGYDVTNTHTPYKTSVTVTKSWQDNNDQDGIRPGEVTVELLANGDPTGKTLVLNEDNKWTGSFTELDQYDAGQTIVYTVQESDVEGYTSVITGDQTKGYVITNSHTAEVVNVSGMKTWDDNNNKSGARPESITINLLKNGQKIESKVVTEADQWSWNFTNLPKYENNGSEIIYSVTEDAVEDYTATYDGYNVLNKYTPDEISITVSKAWADSNNVDGIRPESVTIRLYANGTDTGLTLVLNEANNWTGSFTGLKESADGKTIEYTIDEVAVKGYNTVIKGSMKDGFTVTNSHTHTPKTGDMQTPGRWIALMAIAMVIAASGIYFCFRKRRTA